jgi:hypothetical protein
MRPKRWRKLASTAMERTGRRSAATRWGHVEHEEARADACADRLLVRADPSLSYIWAGNGSPGPRLSVCVGPLGGDLPNFLSARTRSDAGWSFASARWRCPKGPPNSIWGRRRRKSCPVVLQSSSTMHILFGAPDPNPVHGGQAGAPTRRVTHRVAHCQQHDRRFILSTRPSPRLLCRITAPVAALRSGAASRRVGTWAGVNACHACTPAARHAYKILSRRHC